MAEAPKWEDVGRAQKVLDIVDYARFCGLRADQLAAMDVPARNLVSAAAGRRPPSDATWEAVLRTMRLTEERAARAAVAKLARR